MKKLLSSVSILSTLLVLTGCPSHRYSSDIVPNELVKVLNDAHWSYVDMPRQLLGPGSIVSITENDGIRFRGDISDCVDSSAIKIERGTAAIPNLKSEKSLSLTAFFGYENLLKIGPKLSDVGEVKLELGEAEEEAINEIKLSNWLDQNKDTITPACKRYLTTNNKLENETLNNRIFILTDVLKVKNYKYSFVDKMGVQVELTPGKLPEYITFNTSANATVNREGKIDVTKPLYIAFKKGVMLEFGAPLGAAPNEKADPSQIINRRNSVLTHADK